MLTENEIERAKQETKYKNDEPLHEHPDCIRIAYEWLDTQIKTKNATTKTLALKHIIERWGGRYVSISDVEVAAQLHPEIKGKYPYFNISARLTEPSKVRLSGISEAYKHDYNRRHDPNSYTFHE